MTTAAGASDARVEALSALATRALAHRRIRARAGFRRRELPPLFPRSRPAAPWRGHATLIVMDAPPPMEDCRPFVHVAALLRGRRPQRAGSARGRPGARLPAAHRSRHADLPRGARRRSRRRRSTAMRPMRWSAGSRPRATARCRRTTKRCSRASSRSSPTGMSRSTSASALTPAQQDVLAEAFRLILDNNLAQPQVFVHRDYHSRNLMLAEPNPGILDFQDAVEGPITYDLVSLLRDAYVEWDEERQIDWAVRYWQRARKAGFRSTPISAPSGATSNGWACSGSSRCSASSRGSIIATARRRTWTTCRACSRYLRRACERYDALRSASRAARRDPRRRILTARDAP